MRNYMSITNNGSATGGNAKCSASSSPSTLKTDKTNTMKRDDENLQFAIRSRCRFVLVTQEGEIKRFSKDRRTLERFQNEYKTDWRIYTIRQYKDLTKDEKGQ